MIFLINQKIIGDFRTLEVYFQKAITIEEAEQLIDNVFTSYLEAFHRVILVYAPKLKNYAFAYRYLIAMALMDWNENVNRAITRITIRSPAQAGNKRSHGVLRVFKEEKTYFWRTWLVYWIAYPENRPESLHNLLIYTSCKESAEIKRIKNPGPSIPVEEKAELPRTIKCGCTGGNGTICCANGKCSCVKNGLSCSKRCGCSSGNKCKNIPSDNSNEQEKSKNIPPDADEREKSKNIPPDDSSEQDNNTKKQ
jgi:hypothetical protein